MNKIWSPLGDSPTDPADNRSLISNSGCPSRPHDAIVRQWLDDRAEERRLRFDFFSPEVVNDQGWVILLELYGAHLRGRSVTTERVADACDLPISTVLRYAAHLANHDLVERDGDRADGDLRLSEHGTRKLRSYFSKLVLRTSANGAN